MEVQPNLPSMLSVAGTYYECGEQRGKFYKNAIKQYYSNNAETYKDYEEFYHTEEGGHFIQSMLGNLNKRYPHLMDEFYGIHDGADINRHQAELLLLGEQIEDVRGHMEPRVLKNCGSATKGCSDFFLNNANEVLIGHNEDWPDKMRHNVIIQSHIKTYEMPDGRVIPEQKLLGVFVHPCCLCSATWMNNHGLCGTDDVLLFPRNKIYLQPKTPSTILVRLQQQARTVEELVELMADEGAGMAWGWAITLNFGVFGTSALYNLEVAPTEASRSNTSLKCVQPADQDAEISGTYAHFNNVQHLSDTGSPLLVSKVRQATYDNTPSPQTWDDITALLGNTEHPKYPIYLSHDKSTIPWSTHWTSILDLKRKKIGLYFGNPRNRSPDIWLPYDPAGNDLSDSILKRH